jgi:hypothetical protein
MKKCVIDASGQKFIDLTPEERAQAVADATAFFDYLDHTAKEEERIASIRNDPDRLAIIDMFKTATPDQIDEWVNDNVTDMTSVKIILSTVLKLISLHVKE